MAEYTAFVAQSSACSILIKSYCMAVLRFGTSTKVDWLVVMAEQGWTLIVMQLSVVIPELSATVAEKVQQPVWMNDPLTVPRISAMSPAGKLVKVHIQGYFPFSAENLKLTKDPTTQVISPEGLTIFNFLPPIKEDPSIVLESTTRMISSLVDWWKLDWQIIVTGQEPSCWGRPQTVPLGDPVNQEGRVWKVKEGLSSPTTLNCTVQQSPKNAVGNMLGLRQYIYPLLSIFSGLMPSPAAISSAKSSDANIFIMMKNQAKEELWGQTNSASYFLLLSASTGVAKEILIQVSFISVAEVVDEWMISFTDNSNFTHSPKN